MSEIDWGKAPEGATHHVFTGGLDSHHCWYRVREDGYDFQYSDEMRGWKKGKFQTPASEKLTERPSPAWSGDGLPPVGTVCQWFSPIYGWLGGKVVGHDGTLTVIAHNDGYTGCHPHEVRPIRTPEQIAADERDAAVNGMLCYDALGGSRRGLAEALYDAGYRKP